LEHWAISLYLPGKVEDGISIPTEWKWKSLYTLYGSFPEEHFALSGRAMQLLQRDRTHQYCGCCGEETFTRVKERCKECTACGHLAFPKLAPVIMALVTRGDEILLARGAHFPEKMYSVLAGYVDPGETLEQCVAREVFEEVGIRVKNIRYFGSQPWPFSHSLLVGFVCEWEDGEIHADPDEISDAGWFDASNHPQLPFPLSLSRLMIDAFFDGDKNCIFSGSPSL
jgi:NAD+ diphosphatase